jgi:hypothetical protein
MRFLTVVSVLACCCYLGAGTLAAPQKSADVDDEAVYRELIRTLPTKGQRARSARLELEYWHKAPFTRPPVRKPVKTPDGKPAEILMLRVPADGLPGIDFSMAFLLVRGRVVDWVSCWTYNRTALQDVRLEDVDGDGAVDLAFRAHAGFFGLLDKRRHTRPHDDRVWLYAYLISSKGFESIFPRTDRDLRVRFAYETAGQPVTLRVEGLPRSLRENRLYDCSVSATNTSKRELVIEAGTWLTLEAEDAGGLDGRAWRERRTVLKPGGTLSQRVNLLVWDARGNALTLRCRFVKGRSADR